MENITITLPDGSNKTLPTGSNGLDLAKSIGPGLAKDAVAVVVNNEQKDLTDKLSNNSVVSIITIKSNEGLEIMRHTLGLFHGQTGASYWKRYLSENMCVRDADI